VVQTFVLLEPHALTLIEGSRFEFLEVPTSLPPHFLLLDGLGEGFMALPWPKIPWHEKKSFARNKLLSQNPAHTVFESQPSRSLAQGISGCLTQERERYTKIMTQDTLMGVGFLASSFAHAFRDPTALIVVMPAGTLRLFYLHQGVPLFARTLPCDLNTRQENINATLYHLERHFQTPQEKIKVIHWSTQGLLNALGTYTPKTQAFMHPFEKECARAKRLFFFKKAAPLTSMVLGAYLSFQGYSLFQGHTQKQNLDERVQHLLVQRNVQKQTSPLDPTLLKALASYERLQSAPCPLEILKTLTCLNTSKSHVHALTWKNARGSFPHVRLQVCARAPTRTHDFEKYILGALARDKGAPSFRLVDEEPLTLKDDLPTTNPCLFLETAIGGLHD
jgi:hypothetical protein